jgi:hypothetical protein
MKRTQLDFAVHNVAFTTKNANEMVVDTLLMYSGDFVDAAGQEIKVKPKLLASLADRYMNYLETPLPGENAIRKFFGKAPEKLYRPVSLDHCKDEALKIVGRVIGLEVKDDNDEAFLFGKMRILGAENVERVRDGRLSNVSVSFDYDDVNDVGDLLEISYVFDGAIAGACSFSRSEPMQQVDMKRVEMRTVVMQMQKREEDNNRLEMKLKKLYNMKAVHMGLDKMVKEGLISRADMKKLVYDVSSIDLSKYQVYLRSLRTVALSRKQQRGQISNNMQMIAFDSFMSSLVDNGGKVGMNKKFNAKEVASKIVTQVNKMLNGTQVNAGVPPYMHTPELLLGGLNKEQHEVEDEHLIKFKPEDMERMAHMAHKGEKDELLAFMSECSGMDFKYDDDSEDNDSAEHHKKKDEGYGKESDEVDHKKKKSMGQEAEDEEKEAEGDPGSRDYKKSFKEIEDQIMNLSKEITENKAAMKELNETLLKLTTNTEEK